MNLRSLLSSLALASFFMTLTAFNAANALEQTIASVVTDDPAAPVYRLVVDTNDGREILKFFKDVYVKGVKVRRDLLDQNALRQPRGLVLEQRDKHILMTLRSSDFNFQQGGYVVVDTLFNGATGERKGYQLQIAQGKTQWNIFSGNKAVRELYIQTNKVFLLGAVGIKSLTVR